MITLTIDSVKYPLKPLTIELWSELVKWDIEIDMNWGKIISIATGAPLTALSYATPDQLHLGAVLVADALTLRKPNEKLNLQTLNFGQFVDMETYLSWGLAKTLSDCMKTLEVSTQDANEALWVAEKYIEWRNHIYREYKGLFGGDEDWEEEEESIVQRDPNAVPRAWYKIMVDIANGDVLKLDEVAQQPVKKILNFMSLQKQQRMEEAQRLQKQKREYELQANSRKL
jgi:hypothetical protein